jgi:peroxiredoxin
MKAKLIVAAAALAIGAVAAIPFLTRPDTPEVTFATLSGQSIDLGALRGQVVLVNFWSTTCISCVTEMPRLVETHRRFAPRGYQTIAVAVKSDVPGMISGFTRERSLPFTVAHDVKGEAAQVFGNVRATPTSFLLDKKGRVLKKYVGQPDWAELHALVEKALGA